jgi:hypothetical protein
MSARSRVAAPANRPVAYGLSSPATPALVRPRNFCRTDFRPGSAVRSLDMSLEERL